MKLQAGWIGTWQRLAPRERVMTAAAAGLVLFALFWWTLVAPPLAVLRGADTQHRVLDEQIGRMRALQQQAQALQSQPKQGYDESVRQLESAVRQRLGTNARMAIAGERVTLTLSAVPADALAGWLTQARVNARALPAEAKLTRNPAGTWDGTLVVTLPSR